MNSLNSSFPCRIEGAGTPDLLVSTLGEVSTPLEQGRYFPECDLFVASDGSATEDYFRKHGGLAFYAPLDRELMPAPPVGWCSWMYYGTSVTPDEVLVNARWMAGYLGEYGRFVIQIDDGWQGRDRDWESTRETFPQGMKWLAGRIRELGHTPGLWLCPHGQDKEAFVRELGCFIASGTMGGPFTVDPTTPEGLAHVRRLIKMVTHDWGYGYLKLDGIFGRTINLANGSYGLNEAYQRDRRLLANPEVPPVKAYRSVLEAIREGAGDRAAVGGFCIGAFDAIGMGLSFRTGADVDSEWDKGFLNAVDATMKGYYLHNIAWYNDPDCCLVRLPLSLGMAQAWVTLMGVTGQSLLFGDRMPDLAPERVDLLKRILPVAPVRPFDLFPAAKPKAFFDLKVNRLGRAYDVIACFNYGEQMQESRFLDFEELGLDAEAPYHAYDFWSRDYLGQYHRGLFLDVAPAACRLVTLYPAGDFPVLLSTSRHVTQGWPDLVDYEVDRERGLISGSSEVIAGETYTLTFGLPVTLDGTFGLAGAGIDSGEMLTMTRGRGSATVSWVPIASGEVHWSARFEPEPSVCTFNPGSAPYRLGVRDIDPWTVELYWVSYGSPGAFWLKRDGEFLGYVLGTHCRVGNLEMGPSYKFEVGVAEPSGTQFPGTGSITVTVGETLPETLNLTDLPWETASSGYMIARVDKSVGGGGLNAGGRRYAHGVGTHPNSRITYDLKAAFSELRGFFAIEDDNGMPGGIAPYQCGRALFSIVADGRTILPPQLKVHGESPEPFHLDVTGVHILEFVVELPVDPVPNHAPHANWLNLEVTTSPR